MSRMPSAETQLRAERRENNALRSQLEAARIDCTAYRTRATKAEQEVAEWKRRFDALLKIVPEKV
jgi:hypothetical protein